MQVDISIRSAIFGIAVMATPLVASAQFTVVNQTGVATARVGQDTPEVVSSTPAAIAAQIVQEAYGRNFFAVGQAWSTPRIYNAPSLLAVSTRAYPNFLSAGDLLGHEDTVSKGEASLTFEVTQTIDVLIRLEAAVDPAGSWALSLSKLGTDGTKQAVALPLSAITDSNCCSDWQTNKYQNYGEVQYTLAEEFSYTLTPGRYLMESFVENSGAQGGYFDGTNGYPGLRSASLYIQGPVPEPMTLALAVAGGFGVLASRRWRGGRPSV